MKKQLIVTTLVFLMILGICGSSMACEVKNTSNNDQNYGCGDQNTNHSYYGHHFKHHKHYKHNCCGNDDNSTDLPTTE